MPRALFLIGVLLALSGCSTEGAQVAEAGRQLITGMDVDDVQACAGIPTRVTTLRDGTELLSFEQRNANVGGFNVSLPAVGGFSLAGSGSYCTALVRVAQGQVIGVVFTGDNDDTFGREGVCAPIVRGCLRYPEPARLPAPAEAEDAGRSGDISGGASTPLPQDPARR
jgi:hypothetical protein